jgi:transposase InsO family protein
MCRLYGVTRAGYYRWRSRERSERERQNEALTTAIRAVHAESRGTYGSPRVHQALRRRGHTVGRHRVARLMRAHGIKARVATLRYTSPGMQRYFGAIPNRQQELGAQPDQVWVGDITYLKVGSIYRYLAVVMDKCSRRVVGWSYGPRKDVKLTLGALNRAVQGRRSARRIVFHTDRGIEYAAGAFQERIRELGFTQSMNRPGKMTDNAFIESFFHSMKTDIYHGHRYQSDDEIRAALKSYVPFYNSARLHSSLDYVSPATYEQQARGTGCQ